MEKSNAFRKMTSSAPIRAVSVPFSDIPDQSALFLDFLYRNESVRTYYPNGEFSMASLEAYLPSVLENYSTDRDRLCQALVDIGNRLGCGKRTFENIELLRRPDCVTVVTGQQAGLFTGPLYTIFKALSAIKTAEMLRQQGHFAVPAFWIASEDHDFKEVSEAFVLDRVGKPVRIENHPSGSEGHRPVGEIELDRSISDSIDRLIGSLPVSEHTGVLANMLRTKWSESTGFAEAFGRMLASLFADHGLILVDPLDRTLKELVAPIYAKAVNRSNEIVDAIMARDSELKAAGYLPQVAVDEKHFPLFWHDDLGVRTSMKRTGPATIKSKESSVEFTIADLSELAANEPWRLSPAVTLRPVVQDYLLPTVCYFGGSAEVAYFAQIGAAYQVLGRPVTPVFHRQSLTLVEATTARTIGKYGVEFKDLFRGIEGLLPQIVDEHLNGDGAALFAQAEERINTELNRIDQAISGLDPTLARNLATRRRKIIYHIGALRNKYRRAELEKDEIIGRQITAMFDALLPKGKLQERTINITYFLDRYGQEIMTWLYDAIDLNEKDHRLIYL